MLLNVREVDYLFEVFLTDCMIIPKARDITLKDVDKISYYQLTTMAYFTNMDYRQYQYVKVITYPVNCGVELHIHSQTSTVPPLKFAYE